MSTQVWVLLGLCLPDKWFIVITRNHQLMRTSEVLVHMCVSYQEGSATLLTVYRIAIEGFQPEWCISTIYHAWDTPFWSGTDKLCHSSLSPCPKHLWTIPLCLCSVCHLAPFSICALFPFVWYQSWTGFRNDNHNYNNDNNKVKLVTIIMITRIMMTLKVHFEFFFNY